MARNTKFFSQPGAPPRLYHGVCAMPTIAVAPRNLLAIRNLLRDIDAHAHD
jgi:hypothetical protein